MKRILLFIIPLLGILSAQTTLEINPETQAKYTINGSFVGTNKIHDKKVVQTIYDNYYQLQSDTITIWIVSKNQDKTFNSMNVYKFNVNEMSSFSSELLEKKEFIDVYQEKVTQLWFNSKTNFKYIYYNGFSDTGDVYEFSFFTMELPDANMAKMMSDAITPLIKE